MHLRQTIRKQGVTRLLLLLAGLLAFAGCTAAVSIDEARTAYFAAVDGTDSDCEGWLDWCLAEGYPEAACEQRNEYCVNGEWVGEDRNDDDDEADPCDEEARRVQRQCIEDGGSKEECREAAALAYEECAGEE